MKKAFIIVTLLLGIVIMAMILTKPLPEAHYEATRRLAQSVVEHEVNSENVKNKVAQVGSEKLADLGSEGVDAETLEKLGADIDLTAMTEVGREMAMNTANIFLQSNLSVNDYLVVNIGMVNFRGRSLPLTFGAFGKVFVLANEDQVKNIVNF